MYHCILKKKKKQALVKFELVAQSLRQEDYKTLPGVQSIWAT